MYPRKNISPRHAIALLTVFSGCSALHAQAQGVSTTIAPSGNPANANPPNIIVGAGPVGMNTAYTLTVSSQSSDFYMNYVQLFAFENDFTTNYKNVALNGGKPKYTFTGSGRSFLLSHSFTLTNQAWGGYSWEGYGLDNGGDYAVSSIYGPYSS